MRKILIGIIIIIILAVIVEMVYLLGFDYIKTYIPSTSPQNLPNPMVSPTSLVLQEPETPGDSFLTADGSFIQDTPAVNKSYLDRWISPLLHVNKGLLKSATIRIVYTGIVDDINLNASFILNNKQYHDMFLIRLRDKKTNIVNYVVRVSNDKIGMYQLYKKTPDGLTPINMGDIQIGSQVEIEDYADVANNTVLDSKITVY